MRTSPALLLGLALWLSLAGFAQAAPVGEIVRITTTPSEAIVHFNGGPTFLGTAIPPIDKFSYELLPGTYRIQVTSPGYNREDMTIVVCTECPNDFVVDLMPSYPETFTLVRDVLCGGSQPEVGPLPSVQLFDWDADGFDDLMIFDSRGGLRICRNTGSPQGQFGPMENISIEEFGGLDGPTRFQPVDWDNDPGNGQGFLPEALVALPTGDLMWVRYQGRDERNGYPYQPYVVPLHDDVGNPIQAYPPFQVLPQDVDGSPGMDMILIGGDGRVNVFSYTGWDPELQQPRLKDLGSPFALPPGAFASLDDLDKDGVPDFVHTDDRGMLHFTSNPLGFVPSNLGQGFTIPVMEFSQGVPQPVDLSQHGQFHTLAMWDIFKSDNLRLHDLIIGTEDGKILALQATHMLGDATSDKVVNGFDVILLNLRLGLPSDNLAVAPFDIPAPPEERQPPVRDGVVDEKDRSFMEVVFGRTYTPCGDGRIDPGEMCDDGNLDWDATCTPFCTFP